MRYGGVHPDAIQNRGTEARLETRQNVGGFLARTLVAGGKLHVATDHEDYWVEIEPLLDGHPAFDRLPAFGGEEFPVPLGQPLTNYEEKYLVEGRNRFKGSWSGNRDKLLGLAGVSRHTPRSVGEGGLMPAGGKSPLLRIGCLVAVAVLVMSFGLAGESRDSGGARTTRAPSVLRGIATPVSVSTTSYWSGTNGFKDNMIDGSGLSGAGNVWTQVHDASSTAGTMWHTGPDDGGLGGPVGSPPVVNSQAIVFDLGSIVLVDGIWIWNHNQQGLTGRGVNQFEILVSTDSNPTTATYTTVGNFQLSAAGGIPGEPAQLLTFAASDARLVKLDIDSVHSALTSDYVGLSEVRIRTVPAFELENWALNAGGTPAAGSTLTSASHAVTLASLGDTVTATGLGSASFSLDVGFGTGYPAPGEVAGTCGGTGGCLIFTDELTLRWPAERAAGSYNLYRDLTSNLTGLGYGQCEQQNLSATTTTDSDPVPANDSFFYVVTVENRLGEEGSKGFRSGTIERQGAVCP